VQFSGGLDGNVAVVMLTAEKRLHKRTLAFHWACSAVQVV